MRIPFLPNHWLGLRWSLLGTATFAVLCAAGHYEELTSPSAAPGSSTVGQVKRGKGDSILHGSLSGILSKEQPVSEDVPGVYEARRAQAPMDREWRDHLAARNSGNPPPRASFWNFVTGANPAGTDTEYGLVSGESLDETFFREMRTLIAKTRREVRPEYQASWEEAEAASASLRAALIANFANLTHRELPEETDFWVAMVQAGATPIDVQPQEGTRGAGGDSATGTSGLFAGDGGTRANYVPPSSDWSGSAFHYSSPPSSGTSIRNIPTPPTPPIPLPLAHPVSYSHSTLPGQNGHHPSSKPSSGGVTRSHTSFATPAPTISSTTLVAETAPSGTVASSPQAVVSSAPVGSVARHASLAAPAAPPNYIYVANFGAGTVNEYNSTTGAINTGFTPISLSNVANVALSGSTLYVGTFTGSGTIGTYNMVNGAAINANLVTGINQMEGMVVSGNAIYVTSFGSGVLAYDATTGAALAGFSAPAVSGPRGIAISGNRLYVVSTSTDSVVVLNATTGALISTFTFGSNVVQASAIAVSGNTMYIDDTNLGRIGQYDATTGAVINSNFVSSSGTVFQLFIQGNDLYVPNFANNVLGVFDMTTGLVDSSVTAPSGLNRPFSVAVIPEPGSFVLLAAGAAAVLSRRRRRGALEHSLRA